MSLTYRASSNNGQQENVQLDFKLKEHAGHGNFSDADKRTLSEALSGFSNSAGGTLIWGVDARKGADGVDCAKGLVPISDISRFQANATSLVAQFIMPRHEGIRICAVRCAQDNNKGYLIVDIDRSERRPHKSEAEGKKVILRELETVSLRWSITISKMHLIVRGSRI